MKKIISVVMIFTLVFMVGCAKKDVIEESEDDMPGLGNSIS